MAETPTPESPDQSGVNISPSPVDGQPEAPATQTDPTDQAAPAPAPTPETSVKTVAAEPLPDGTIPTVLTTGTSHKSVSKGRASITSIYRKADILSTILTFVGALVAAAAIFGVYSYLTRNRAPAAKAPAVTTLDKAELSKLQTFFQGNSAGKTSEILTISSSSLFKERVAIASDLKVVGGVQVSGTTALGDLTVDKVSTLGVTNVRGALTVSGPVNLQSPTILGAGATVNGNITVSGNGSFGGSLSAGIINTRDISVSGNLNLAGHILITGKNSAAVPGSEAGSGATATVDGNDSAGTVTINTGTIPAHVVNIGGLLGKVTFSAPFGHVPHVVITPIGQSAASLNYYVQKTTNDFTIGSTNYAQSNTSYSFDYWVVQ